MQSLRLGGCKWVVLRVAFFMYCCRPGTSNGLFAR